jgi:hypothetical protein
MIRKLALAVASVTLLGSGSAYALTPSAPSNFGEVTLVTGFTPDPYSIDLVAGGGVDVSTQGLPPECRGFVTDAPDYKLFYTGGNVYSLFIYAMSDADVTLVINDPSGNWICDDDSLGSLNPLVTLNSPAPSGRYDIWVGTYSSGNQPATLYISEINPAGGGGGGGGGGGANVIDPNLPPLFGSVTLLAGNPTTQQVQAGGPIAASTANPNCSGSVTAAPTMVVNFATIAGILPLVISAESQQDTTLVVRDPSGTFHCNDDTNGLNPQVTITGPQGGTYAIWVGVFGGGGGGTSPATLRVSYGLPGTK